MDRLAHGLAGRGHEVTVVTVRPLGDRGLPRRGREDGIRVVRLAAGARRRGLALAPGVLPLRLDVGGFDTVHVFGLYDLLGPVMAGRSKRAGVPVIVEPLGMNLPRIRSIPAKRAYMRMFGWMLRDADLVVVNSEAERRDALAAGVEPARIGLRLNGIDLSEFGSLPPSGRFRARLGLPRGVPLILFLGRVSPKKRPDLLVDILADLPGSPWLAVVGPEEEPRYAARLRSLAQNRGVGDRTVFVGPLYGLERVEAFVDADVFALPSQWENFGFAVIEAMAAGTPVVVSEQCGVAPLLEGGGLVVPLQRESFKAALASILEDPRLRSDMGSRARAVGTRMTWDRPVEWMEERYRLLRPCRAYHYDEHPFDSAPRRSTALSSFAASPGVVELAKAAPEEAVVLDVGCGVGRNLTALRELRLSFGFDISLVSLRRVHQRLGVTGICADNLALPIRSGTADIVVSDGVLHHTSDPRAAFRENARVLRDGGYLYVAVYKPWGYYPRLYRGLGGFVRIAVRSRMGRQLVHATLLPSYWAARRLKSGARDSWEGTVNLFYDYLVTPRASFHAREEVESWGRESGLTLETYDPTPASNVHVFVMRKGTSA